MNIPQLKEAVCAANLDLVRHGLVTLTWGNVGEWTDDGDALVIKPSGVPYEKLTPREMVVVAPDGTILEGENQSSSDTPTYLEVYAFFRQKFPFLRGMVHTHSTSATAWAQARCEIPCLGTTHADHFFGSVPVTRPLTEEEVREAYERNTGKVIVERFSAHGLDPEAIPGVLAAGHAPFTWGNSASKAVQNAVALEAVAEMALKTFQIAQSFPALESYVLEKHYSRKHGPNAYYGQKANTENRE